MRIGFGLPVSGTWATPERLGRVAVAAEHQAYDSLWTFQRLFVGVEQQLDPVYRSVLDPLVALGFAAARTETVRLGVAVVNLPFVHPVYLAKQIATLDVLSGGRVDLGLGTGWSETEFAAVGASAERRAARTREFVSVLRTLWRDEVSQYDGEFYTVPPGRMAPRPAQEDGVPILLGGSVPAALRRAGEIAEGWVTRSAHDLSEIGKEIELVRAGAEKAGRDPDAVRIVCRAVLFRPGRDFLAGSWEKIREDVAWLATQGVTEIFYDLNFDPTVAGPDVDPDAAEERAMAVLHNLTPRGLS